MREAARPVVMGATVYVVENHRFMREMIVAYVGRMVPASRVIGSAGSAEAALESLSEVRPDLLLVDLSLGGASGIDLVRTVGARWPEVRCLILSGHRDRALVEAALAAGAWGYLIKSDTDELPVAIRAILGGERYVSRDLRE